MKIFETFLTLTCSALLFLCAPAPAGSVVLTDAAPIASPPVTVVPGAPVALEFDFTQSFSSISSAQFTLTFETDLMDPGESYYLGIVGGQINITASPKSGTVLGVNPQNAAFFADLLDGSISLLFEAATPQLGPSSFGLASVVLQINATLAEVPEPAPLAVMATVLIGFALARRRNNA